MKKIHIALILAVFFTAICEAQEYTAKSYSFSTSFNVNQNTSYTARDSITFLSGTFIDGSNGTLGFGIDEALIFGIENEEYVDPQVIENRTIDKQLDFGSLPGFFNVSSSGAANYSIPIYTPPGAKGSSPSLSVFYNSSMQEGLLGVGWSISGSSTIHRMGRNFFEDDSVVDAINMDTTDLLAIDGNRLILKSGSYGIENSTYGTKFESSRNIEAYGTTGNGPSYFIVTDNRGYEYEYGNTSDSKVLLAGKTTIYGWKLNKVTDSNGNYILYEYDNSNSGQAYLTSIKYSGNDAASIDPYNEIKILYQEREDNNIKYLLGEEINDAYLVRRIQSFADEARLREYQFNYSFDRRTYLSEIIEINQYGDKYNSTIIGWNDFADTVVKDTLSTFHNPEFVQFGDFNNDGYSDYFTINDTVSSGQFTAKLFLNQGNGSYNYAATDSVTYNKQYIDHFLGDFNGDGKSDVVIVTMDNCEWIYDQTIHIENYFEYIFLAGPDLTEMDIVSSASCGGPTSDYYQIEYTRGEENKFFVSDINRDGFSDFVAFDDEGYILYGNEAGEGFNIDEIDFVPGGVQNFLCDFTGDGIPDFATFNGTHIKFYSYDNDVFTLINTTYIPAINRNIYTGDFNGDGIQDLSYQKYPDEWYIRYGTGIGFATEVLQFNDDTYPTDSYFFEMILDFNGDGKDDLIGMINTLIELPAEGWLVYFKESIGNRIFTQSSISDVEYDFEFSNTKVADITGDGMLELIILNENRYFSYNPGDQHDLVKFIEDGVGKRTSITYNTLLGMKEESTYDQNGNFDLPMQSVLSPMSVVESVETSSSLNNDEMISKTEYTYTDAVIHKQGLGFLGFKNIERKTDSVHSSKSYHSFSAPDYYASVDSVQGYYNGNLISSQSSNKKFHERTYSGGSSYIIYSDTSTTTDYLNDNQTVTFSSVDSLGNISWSKTIAEDGSYQEVYYYNYLEEGSQFPQRVVRNTKHKDDSNVFSSESRFSYDTVNFRLEQVIENYGKANESVTDFSDYDYFGNAGKIESQPKGLSKQALEMEFDQSGRFLTSKTSVLGEIAYTYDPSTGQLISEKGIYGDSLSYQYNTWGALIKTISSFGISKTVSLSWAEASDPAGTLYSVLTQEFPGTYSKQFVDYKGRTFRSENEGFQGSVYYSDTKFNPFNQVDSSSNMYSSGGSPLWNTYSYQSTDGRISNQSFIGGAEINYSYSPKQLEKTINNTKTYSYEFDATGNVTTVEDPLGNTLSYTYSSTGSGKSVSGNGGTLSTVYNEAGIDTLSVDPSLGTVQQSVNALGQPTWIKDGKGNEFEFSYDTLYRLIRKENANNSAEYYTVSYVASGNGKGQVDSTSYTDGSLTTTLSYSYDEHGRVRSESKQIGIRTFSVYYAYDEYGRLDSITNSNGDQFDYWYDDRSYLAKIYFNEDLIWELDVLNLTERTVNYGQNISVTDSFDTYGQLSRIVAEDLFDMSYSFSSTTGNLLSRTQRIFNLAGTCIDTLSEFFSYDELDRLLEISRADDTLAVSYDTNKKERIASKDDAGAAYNYAQGNAFQLESIDTATSTLINRPDQYISYTSFNKVDTIVEGNYLINFDYGPNQERVKMEVKYHDTLQYTRYYFGSYELTEYAGGAYEKDTWFSADEGIFGFNRKTSTTDSTYFILKDHLGSVMTVAGEDGNAREFMSYDAWGRRRNASNWSYDTTLTVNYTSRGYTGHEHIDETCLINMNGRVYDPLVGLFLSPDPMLQEPMNPLNYNRYTYVLNNPLKYSDPSGYNYEWDPRWADYDPDAEKDRQRMGNNLRWLNYADPSAFTGGGSYADRIKNMHSNPNGWSYQNGTGEFYNARTGQRASSLEHALAYLGQYLVKRSTDEVIVALQYHDNLPMLQNRQRQNYTHDNNSDVLFQYVNSQIQVPRITPYGGSYTYQILVLMEFIVNNNIEIYLEDVVSSSLFDANQAIHGSWGEENVQGREGEVSYTIFNPNYSKTFYSNHPIVEVYYSPSENFNSLEVRLQNIFTNDRMGPIVISLRSTNYYLIYDYYCRIYHFKKL